MRIAHRRQRKSIRRSPGSPRVSLLSARYPPDSRRTWISSKRLVECNRGGARLSEWVLSHTQVTLRTHARSLKHTYIQKCAHTYTYSYTHTHTHTHTHLVHLRQGECKPVIIIDQVVCHMVRPHAGQIATPEYGEVWVSSS